MRWTGTELGKAPAHHVAAPGDRTKNEEERIGLWSGRRLEDCDDRWRAMAGQLREVSEHGEIRERASRARVADQDRVNWGH